MPSFLISIGASFDLHGPLHQSELMRHITTTSPYSARSADLFSYKTEIRLSSFPQQFRITQQHSTTLLSSRQASRYPIRPVARTPTAATTTSATSRRKAQRRLDRRHWICREQDLDLDRCWNQGLRSHQRGRRATHHHHRDIVCLHEGRLLPQMDTTGETGTEIGEGKAAITTRRRMGIGIAGRETRGEQTIITAGGTLIFLSQHRISTVGTTIRTAPRAKVARDHVQDHAAPVSPLLHAAGSSAVFTNSSIITPALPRRFLPVLCYAASQPNAPPPLPPPHPHAPRLDTLPSRHSTVKPPVSKPLHHSPPLSKPPPSSSSQGPQSPNRPPPTRSTPNAAPSRPRFSPPHTTKLSAATSSPAAPP
ncbi:hypothetical protein M422DRAFT_244136 [Sphaerobolus stellatus SS14]|nr:hypothetical protein M422DRAFT_244136 [Sphaerobolus stellatus SS14]